MSDNKQPVERINIYPVSAAIWKNESTKGVFYSVTFERSYRDEQDKWPSFDELQPQRTIASGQSRRPGSQQDRRTPRPRPFGSAGRPNGRLTSRGRALTWALCSFFLSPIMNGAFTMTTTKIRLSWSFLDDGSAVLTFNKDVWPHFQNYAREIGMEADKMISLLLVRRIGKVMDITSA